MLGAAGSALRVQNDRPFRLRLWILLCTVEIILPGVLLQKAFKKHKAKINDIFVSRRQLGTCSLQLGCWATKVCVIY